MDAFIALYIFLLAAFSGYAIASRVPGPLHAHLLTASSFLNGIVLIGAMIAMAHADTTAQFILGFIAVTLASANLVGGYMLTKQILKVFAKSNKNFDSGEE